MGVLKKYANLITDYCLDLQKGEKLYVSTTMLAEPLVREVYKSAILRGAIVTIDMNFSGQAAFLLNHGTEEQLSYVSPNRREGLEAYDAYLVIRAPYNLREEQEVNASNRKFRSDALHELNQTYFSRTASGSLKRTLCQYPTHAAAQEAGMSLDDYSDFVYNACKLHADRPKEEWLKVRRDQQHLVDYLNNVDTVQYKNQHMDVTFRTKNRIWMNSDGRTNMPSGEVYTGPIEESVNGVVYFDYPSVFKGKPVSGIRLEIKDGEVISWSAKEGEELLDEVFQIDGARCFGEVAIGTNYSIRRATKNILFDEKIGGTIHMAIGQSYKQTGGKNESSIHWDMIADMTEGSIIADGKKIYENGRFLGDLRF